ncbi:MAG TPA: hypothetical protein VFV28_01560, partial [Limnobacter sp.]|nr:hypothetical protein [Limnobacter sp.]
MKLAGIEPFGMWDWYLIAMPFLLAVCWFEVIEPLLGLDVKRQETSLRLFEQKIRALKNKKPRRGRRG